MLEKFIKDFCKMETFRGHNQSINQMERGVRLSIKEIGLMVESSYHRSQLQNRDVCVKMLLAAIATIPEEVLKSLVATKIADNESMG